MKDLILFSCDSSPPAFAITEGLKFLPWSVGTGCITSAHFSASCSLFCPVGCSPSDTWEQHYLQWPGELDLLVLDRRDG